MNQISRVKLFGKLNDTAFRTMETATEFCRLRGNSHVGLEHWLHQVLQQQDSDLHRIVNHFALDWSTVSRDVLRALERLPAGAQNVEDLAASLDESMERGWLYGAVQLQAERIRTGHLLLGMLGTSGLRRQLLALSAEFARIDSDVLLRDFDELLVDSPEKPVPGTGTPLPIPQSGQSALQRYSQDLTEQARRGQLDPVLGRNSEVAQLIDVLMRRRQNNPLLAGEAGVGKTAVVEGFAQRIAAGDVPAQLREARVLALDIGLLQAGASLKGEFEQRLRQVVDEVQASTQATLLFIDEIHTLVGAGGNAGTGDAANLLKPMLARGALRTIGATTWSEYKKHIEKDPALKRRFQVLRVEEPSPEVTMSMLRSLLPTLEQHHRVSILDEALQAAVNLSHRYLPDRQLPDKAISLMDTACARVGISQQSLPLALTEARHTIANLDVELAMIDRERALGLDDESRQTSLLESLAVERGALHALEVRWEQQSAMVNAITELSSQLRSGKAPPGGREQLQALNRQLAECQVEQPLIQPAVDRQAVAAVLQSWTGIPVGTLQRDEIDTLMNLAERLGERVIGQDHALQAIAQRIQTSRAGLDDPGKPVGVFLLAGPSGVGKTETALALADLLYGGEQNLVTLNMSEYQEAHTVASLKGAPPGYVGYGEGGVLTEAVRRRPHCVVLLDEVEKAHSDVHEVFFQVFDKGWMEDGEGQVIDFRNTLILMTSNVGSEELFGVREQPAERHTPEYLQNLLRPVLLRTFPPALLGRLTAVPYFALNARMLGRIVELQLQRVITRVAKRYDVALQYGPEVVDCIVAHCVDLQSGGRMVDTVLNRQLLPQLSGLFLQATQTQERYTSVTIYVAQGVMELAVSHH